VDDYGIIKISSYVNVDDREIIKLYQKTKSSLYLAVIICRYEYLILKIIKQWRIINRGKEEVNESDSEDVLHTAYLGVMIGCANVKDVDAIKNVGSRIKASIYNELDKNI